MTLGTSSITERFIAAATDREVQNQIYVTLREIEIHQEDSAKSLSTIRTIVIVYLICSIIAGVIIGISLL